MTFDRLLPFNRALFCVPRIALVHAIANSIGEPCPFGLISIFSPRIYSNARYPQIKIDL